MNPLTFLFLSLFLAGCAKGEDVEGQDFRNVELSQVELKAGESLLQIAVTLPAAHHFAEGAPSYIKWKSAEESVLKILDKKGKDPSQSQGKLELRTQSNSGRTEIEFEAKTYYCTDDMKMCFSDFLKARLPVEVTAEAPSEVSVNLDVKLPTQWTQKL